MRCPKRIFSILRASVWYIWSSRPLDGGGGGGGAVSKKNFFDPSGLSLVHLVIQTLRWGQGGGGGGGVQKEFFRSFGPQFGLKIEEGWPPGPFPGSASASQDKINEREVESVKRFRLQSHLYIPAYLVTNRVYILLHA